MAMVVQHNMQAMNSSRMLGTTTSAQAKSTEKLSSGFKINRAADDAAGLTISEKMRKQIKGLNRASTNAQDGVSAVQTAEGALTEVHSMLQRMNELSTQAANGSNSKSDRDAIQAEIDQLTTEIDRVAETTKFNETYLLKGDTTVQDKKINLEAHDAGLKGTLIDNGDGTAKFIMDKLSVGDTVQIGGKTYTIGDSAGAVQKAASKALGTVKDGDTMTVNGKEYKYYDATNKYTKSDGTVASVAAGWYAAKPAEGNSTAKTLTSLTTAGHTVTVNGKSYHALTGAGSDGIDDNDTSIITDKKAYLLAAAELKKANQIGDTLSKADVGKGVSGEAIKTQLSLGNAGNVFDIQVAKTRVPESLSFNLHVGADADMTNKIGVDIDAMTSANLGVKNINVSDESGNAATYAIDAIADAISKVSAQRSSLGAIQNRLEHTIANLDNISENTTSAESRIRDTDMAAEMVEYSKNNILAQAGQSMLAQATQSNQGVLSLLR